MVREPPYQPPLSAGSHPPGGGIVEGRPSPIAHRWGAAGGMRVRGERALQWALPCSDNPLSGGMGPAGCRPVGGGLVGGCEPPSQPPVSAGSHPTAGGIVEEVPGGWGLRRGAAWGDCVGVPVARGSCVRFACCRSSPVGVFLVLTIPSLGGWVPPAVGRWVGGWWVVASPPPSLRCRLGPIPPPGGLWRKCLAAGGCGGVPPGGIVQECLALGACCVRFASRLSPSDRFSTPVG